MTGSRYLVRARWAQAVDQALRCHCAVGVLADGLDLYPVHLAAEPHAEPSPRPHIRGPEEPVGRGGHEPFLGSYRGRTPNVGKVVFMVAIWPQHDELLTDKESRRAVAELLGHPGQGEANAPDPLLHVRNGHSTYPTQEAVY